MPIPAAGNCYQVDAMKAVQRPVALSFEAGREAAFAVESKNLVHPRFPYHAPKASWRTGQSGWGVSQAVSN